MDRKEELLGLERERWEEFRLLVDRVPADRMEDSTLNADGWSVKDLLWHMGRWDEEVAVRLERIRLGTYEEQEDDTDGMNARFLEEGRRMDLESVRDAWLASRERARQEMAAVGEVTPPVEEWFSESAYKHVDDHAEELRRFVEGETA